MRRDLPEIPDVRPLAFVEEAVAGVAAVPVAEVLAEIDQAMAERELRRLAREEAVARAPRTSRWWCRCCSAFVRSEHVACARCRDQGPHVFGEESPTGGNQARRQRLRREQRARKRVRR